MEDMADEEQSPPSDTEDEKMYRDADEVESFGAEALVFTGRLRALMEHLGIATTPRYRIKEVSQRFSSDSESSADTRDQLSGPLTAMLLLMPPGRPSHHGSIATSALQEEGTIQGLWDEEGYL
jgi:hypothetical protein